MKFWPMVHPDIFNYLMFFPSELGSKDLINDYKNSKAYSYYKSGWLGQLWYHCIDGRGKFCVLKADCRKSQSDREKISTYSILSLYLYGWEKQKQNKKNM